MELYIGETLDRTSSISTIAQNSDGGLFQSELADAIGRQSDGLSENSDSSDTFPNYFGKCSDSMVVISPKIEEKMQNDPEYSEQLSQKLKDLLQNQGKCMKDSIVIVSRDGEITQYCTRHKHDDLRTPSAEELKAVARARARKKARLDAYFHLLERVAIKRKLIEQENAKRLLNKKHRLSVSSLDIVARTQQITAPPANPEYFF